MKKKTFFLLSLILMFFSCDKDNFIDVPLKARTNVPLTRSAVNVPSPIKQLDGIPVNIRNAASKKYLSASSKGYKILLNNNDDGSLRQRWYIGSGGSNFISLVGGNNDYPGGILTFTGLQKFEPMLVKEPFMGLRSPNINLSQAPCFYSITIFQMNAVQSLQPESVNSNNLVFASNSQSKMDALWEIIPIDEFRIVDITYGLTAGDNLVVTPKVVAIKSLVNDTDIPVNRTISLQEVVSNESTFAETEGLSITVRMDASLKFGIPEFIDGSFSSGTTSGKTWSYTIGHKETQSFTISETITQNIPARTTVTAKLIATEYKAALTYIAEMVGVNTGKTIFLKGKWDGTVVKESKIELYYPNGKLIKELPVSVK